MSPIWMWAVTDLCMLLMSLFLSKLLFRSVAAFAIDNMASV